MIKIRRSINVVDRKKTKEEPDTAFDLVIIKMVSALAFSVAFLFAGGTLFVYAAFGGISMPGYSTTVATFLSIHLSILMFYYSVALFKYIVSD